MDVLLYPSIAIVLLAVARLWINWRHERQYKRDRAELLDNIRRYHADPS